MCFVLISNTANALPTFQEWSAGNCPFTFSTINGNSSISVLNRSFADIDGDGDLDPIILANCAHAYFENVNGVYIENLDDNPFRYSWSCGPGCSGYYFANVGTGIDMADFDGDGDLDAIIINGYISGQLTHYQLVSGKFEIVGGSDLNDHQSYSLIGG
jgi:hypothetical protein